MIPGRQIKAAVVALLAALFSPNPLWSWGRTGHRTSSLLAESRLTPAAVAGIRDLLEPGEDLADISTWADRQREVPGTGPWHYVNVPITESRYNARFCQPKGCVVSKIEDFRRVLLDAKAGRNEKQLALKFLVHYLQDLHQPVHAHPCSLSAERGSSRLTQKSGQAGRSVGSIAAFRPGNLNWTWPFFSRY